MKIFSVFRIILSAAVLVTCIEAGEFKAGGFIFKTKDKISARQEAEVLLAFQYAIHQCIEYEWYEKNILPVDFSLAEGAPKNLKDNDSVYIREPGNMDGHRKNLKLSDVKKHYRFVVHLNERPLTKEGNPIETMEPYTPEHYGVIYVTNDASGKVNGVFYYLDDHKLDLSGIICS